MTNDCGGMWNVEDMDLVLGMPFGFCLKTNDQPSINLNPDPVPVEHNIRGPGDEKFHRDR